MSGEWLKLLQEERIEREKLQEQVNVIQNNFKLRAKEKWARMDKLEEQIDGISNGCSLSQQNLTEITKLKNHDIFKIWTSMRKGGKTTLEAMLNNNKGIKYLRELTFDIKKSIKALGGFSNEHAGAIIENMDEIDELEKKYDNRTHLNLNRVRNNEEVFREVLDYFKKNDYMPGGYADALSDKLDSPTLPDPYYACGKLKTEKIPIGDDLMKRITSHKSVPMDKSKYKKASGGIPDHTCYGDKCFICKEASGDENLRLVSTPQTSVERWVMGEGKEASIDSKLPEVKKSQFVKDVEKFQDSLDARTKFPQPEFDVPYCYQDRCVQPYKTPESLKWIKEYFEKNEAEPDIDYEIFVQNYEGYWKNKYDKLIEKILKQLKTLYNDEFWDSVILLKIMIDEYEALLNG